MPVSVRDNMFNKITVVFMFCDWTIWPLPIWIDMHWLNFGFRPIFTLFDAMHGSYRLCTLCPLCISEQQDRPLHVVQSILSLGLLLLLLLYAMDK